MSHHEGHSQHHHTPEAATQVAKDPVCGMDVDPQSAIHHEHAGKTFHFCSEHCRTKFQEDPGKYANA